MVAEDVRTIRGQVCSLWDGKKRGIYVSGVYDRDLLEIQYGIQTLIKLTYKAGMETSSHTAACVSTG